jgi:hypothetical protein
VLACDEEAVFRAVCNACRAHLESSDGRGILDVFAAEQPDTDEAAQAWLRDFLPSVERWTGFDDWARGKEGPYLLHVSHLHRFDRQLSDQISAFAAELVRHVGLPTGQLWVDAYVGRYARTPFGTHLDGASNFTLGVKGTKDLHLWEPEEYWSAYAEAGGQPADLESRLGPGRVMSVVPGRVVYWPARYWHVAVPGAGLSVTLNIACYWQEEPHDQAAELRAQYFRKLHDPISLAFAFREELSGEDMAEASERLGPILARSVLPRVGPRLDRRGRESVQAVRSGPLTAAASAHVVSMRERHQRELVEEVVRSLGHVSSWGLGPAPDALTALEPETRLRAVSPLVWYELDARDLRLGARGRVLRLTPSPALLELLALLASGRASTVASMIAICASVELEGRTVDTLELVESLVRSCALAPE